MRKIVCLCEQSFEYDVPEEVDLDEKPEIQRAIQIGEFLSIPCPHCAKILKPEFPMRFTQKSRGIDLYFVPELDRGKLLRGSYALPPCERVVIGFPELVEKLAIMRSELDDRAVEVVKYYLLSRAVESAGEEGEIRIFFKEKRGERLLFHIEGLRDGEIGVFEMSLETYDKALVTMNDSKMEEPLATLLTPPYVSINKLYGENTR